MPDELDAHYNSVIRGFIDGEVVPFFGAGVNLVGRPKDAQWKTGKYLPSGSELSTFLADTYQYPGSDKQDLVRVSQYISVMEGSGPLYGKLRKLLDADYPTTSLHQFFARLPSALKNKGYPSHHQLIVTTNYDDVMERAFREVNEPFDLVTFIAGGDHRGKFMHFDGNTNILIEKPNEYRGLALDQRPVILKIHGAINRLDPDGDSFVITEDDYIDYLTRTDISSLVPVTLAAKLKNSHFLFLGYGLRDWNLRVILHRIWGGQKLTYKSWAIQLDPPYIEKKFWEKRDVDLIGVSLDEYIAEMEKRIQAWTPFGGEF